MSNYLTVVFEIDDQDSFKPVSDEIFERFSVDVDEFKDWRVTAVSTEDEISKIEELEEELGL